MPWYETPCIRVLQSSLWPWLSRLAPIGISSQPFLSPLALFGDCLTKKPFLLKISPATRSIAPKSAGASSRGFFDLSFIRLKLDGARRAAARALLRALPVTGWPPLRPPTAPTRGNGHSPGAPILSRPRSPSRALRPAASASHATRSAAAPLAPDCDLPRHMIAPIERMARTRRPTRGAAGRYSSRVAPGRPVPTSPPAQAPQPTAWSRVWIEEVATILIRAVNGLATGPLGDSRAKSRLWLWDYGILSTVGGFPYGAASRDRQGLPSWRSDSCAASP